MAVPSDTGGITPMKNKIILTSAIAFSLIVAGFFFYNVRLPITADSVIGFATVLTIAAVAAIEYRLHGRRTLSK